MHSREKLGSTYEPSGACSEKKTQRLLYSLQGLHEIGFEVVPRLDAYTESDQ